MRKTGLTVASHRAAGQLASSGRGRCSRCPSTARRASRSTRRARELPRLAARHAALSHPPRRQPQGRRPLQRSAQPQQPPTPWRQTPSRQIARRVALVLRLVLEDSRTGFISITSATHAGERLACQSSHGHHFGRVMACCFRKSTRRSAAACAFALVSAARVSASSTAAVTERVSASRDIWCASQSSREASSMAAHSSSTAATSRVGSTRRRRHAARSVKEPYVNRGRDQ